jgi:hypothetical protein
MTIFVVYWWDKEDRIYRVAGVYQRKDSADRRLLRLGSGNIQRLTLNKRVRFTWEMR